MLTQTPVFDPHANLVVATVATAPSPATSGATLTVQTGRGSHFPAVPFNATLFPTSSTSPDYTNCEIVRVTAMSGDNITAMTRGQEGTSALAVDTTYSIAASVTLKTLTDIERHSRPASLVGELVPHESSMQTVEYGGATTGNIQTLYVQDTGVAGTIRKIKITGSGNGMLNGWLQISYDGGQTFPFVAEMGTLFGAYPGGSSTESFGAWEASCGHLSTQQVAGPSSAFYATHIMTLPIPFTNGILVQVFNPTAFSYSEAPYAEITADIMPAADVDPMQLCCTGSNSGIIQMAISALTFSGTTWTATVVSTSSIVVGGSVQLNGVTGYTTNPSGTQTVASVISSTQFTFTATTGGSGSYGGAGTLYNWTTTQGTNGLTLNLANVAMYGSIFGDPAALTAAQVGQLAHLTGFAGWAVGLAYVGYNGTNGITYLERNFGWYMDGATPPNPAGSVTTPTAKVLAITGMTFSGTAVTATVSASTGIAAGQTVQISGVKGLTNVNGYWIVSSVAAGTVTFTVNTAPTGTFTASGTGLLFSSGSPYGTQVGSPSMQTTGTEDTFDSAYYNWAQTFPAAGLLASPPAVGATTAVVTNPYGVPFDVYIKNGAAAITVVAVNGSTTGFQVAASGFGMVRIPPMGTIALTYASGTPTWTWFVSDYPTGGPNYTYSSPCAMGLGNATTSHGHYYNAYLDILQSCGGYRFASALDLWLLTESHCTDSATISWCLIYYKDLS